MKKNAKKIIVACIVFFSLAILIKVKAEPPIVSARNNENCSLEVLDNGENGEKREIMLNLNDIAPGNRVDKIIYCKVTGSTDCSNDNDWHDVHDYDESNIVTSYQNGVGTDELTFFVTVPNPNTAENESVIVDVTFVPFEPMNISYSPYKLSTTNENEYRDVYVDGTTNLQNYEENYTNLVTGYKGGDIILPAACNGGCALKVTLADSDYESMIARLNYYNQTRQDVDPKEFLDLALMNNHLSFLPTETAKALTNNNNELIIENGENTKSFYIIINKFFSETNRTEFIVGDNKNRILSEDYIGLDYKVDRKYFDESDGFLTFNEFTEYRQNATLFYGTPLVQLIVDDIRPLSLATGGNGNGMGTIKNPYTKIVSRDQANYPINNEFELTINSFYEPEYVVPIALKNDSNQTVKEIELVLDRFAFGGNAGSLLIVDDKGINCKQPWMNPDCREDNLFVSTSYRGLIDTFYTKELSENNPVRKNTFEISDQHGEIKGFFLNDEELYERNEDFNPWAVAIFYHDDMVVDTKSFNLGELVKTEGFSEEVLPNSSVNNVAKGHDGTMITNYNSSDYTIWGYGLGYEKPINTIKYFSRGSYDGGKIDYPLIIASKAEIIDNDINRIALFLTNGELKADENEFPELTYGVGEGKIFELDGRVFEELGGGE